MLEAAGRLAFPEFACRRKGEGLLTIEDALPLFAPEFPDNIVTSVVTKNSVLVAGSLRATHIDWRRRLGKRGVTPAAQRPLPAENWLFVEP
jgi:hypothetical protein